MRCYWGLSASFSEKQGFDIYSDNTGRDEFFLFPLNYVYAASSRVMVSGKGFGVAFNPFLCRFVLADRLSLFSHQLVPVSLNPAALGFHAYTKRILRYSIIPVIYAVTHRGPLHNAPFAYIPHSRFALNSPMWRPAYVRRSTKSVRFQPYL